jgi:hypothetical protein
MGRLHLMELEDQAWFPRVLRDAMTDWLSFMAGLSSAPFAAMSPRIRAALAASRTQTIVELGAGGGGPATQLVGVLAREGVTGLDLVLTDLYPNVERLELASRKCKVPCRVVSTSVDATSVPRELPGLRFFANAFHHLPEATARKVLVDATASRQPIVIIELVSRSPSGFMHVFIGVAIMLLATPIVRPFRWSRLLFTYLLPLVPLATIWDGLVSCLRIYSPRELEALVASLPANDFRWDIGRQRVPFTPIAVTYLVGHPVVGDN